MHSISTSERYYLSCILLAIEIEERQAPFDVLFRRWWAVRDNIHDKVLDHPDWAMSSVGADPQRFDFISADAAQLLAQGGGAKCQIVPALPERCLRSLLFERAVSSEGELRDTLYRWCRFGAVTATDIDRLRAHGLQDALPDGWSDEQIPYARFDAAGIPIQDVGVANLKRAWPIPRKQAERNGRRTERGLLASTTLSEIVR